MNEEIKKLKSKIQSLNDKNKNLEYKLSIAKFWMIKEIKGSIKKISKEKIKKITENSKNDFAIDNLENIITKKIRKYFGDFILINLNFQIIDNIISAEIAYYQLKQNPTFDGLSVIISYHKAIDKIIEEVITKQFRKFAKKEGKIYLNKNNSLEKIFHSVVNKGYILSVGRLYHILDNIYKNKQLYDYGNLFKSYLNNYIELKEVLLDSEFLSIFKQIIDSEIMGKKRHSGYISFVETRKARKLIIGNLNDKKSFIYMLLKTKNIDY